MGLGLFQKQKAQKPERDGDDTAKVLTDGKRNPSILPWLQLCMTIRRVGLKPGLIREHPCALAASLGPTGFHGQRKPTAINRVDRRADQFIGRFA